MGEDYTRNQMGAGFGWTILEAHEISAEIGTLDYDYDTDDQDYSDMSFSARYGYRF